MQLYLAIKETITLMEGSSEEVLGVFDSGETAWTYLKTTTYYEDSEPHKNNENVRVYHFDGELSYYWLVREVELNKPINEYV